MADDREAVIKALRAYEVGDQIGRGPWGVVLRGRHRQLGREVAIKQLPPAFATDPETRARFAREARMLALLDHPHIVPVYDYVEQEGVCLLVMENLPGGSVWSRQADGGFTMPSACGVAAVACAALEHAHARGILHRDVKPDNLLFSADDVLKMTDFGIAKILGGSHTLATQTGLVLGTPAYMSPEQATGGTLGPGADIYAVGVMLYELLAGRLPFVDDGDVLAMLSRRANSDPVPLADAAPDVPRELADVVMRALERDPGARYADAAAFAKAISSAAADAWGDGWSGMSDVRLTPASGADPGRTTKAAGSRRTAAARPTKSPAPPRSRTGDAPAPAPAELVPLRYLTTAQAVEPARTVIEPGTRLGAFVIDAFLARTDLATTYRARQVRSRRTVALKVLAAELAADPKVARQFLLAGVDAARLEHPSIVAVHQAGEDAGTLFLATRLVEGTTLEAMLAERGRMTPRNTIAILGRVASALDYARGQGFLHRDVCPATIAVDHDRQVFLSDFTLTAELAEAIPVARPEYTAPEVARGDEYDHRADIYSLACVAFECLTGAPPSPHADLPGDVEAVLRTGLASKPDERPPGARRFVRELRDALGVPSATSVCPACAGALRRGDRSCAHCGAGIGWCASCGASGLAGDRFCVRCGTSHAS